MARGNLVCRSRKCNFLEKKDGTGETEKEVRPLGCEFGDTEKVLDQGVESI